MLNMIADDTHTSIADLIEQVKFEDALYDAESRTAEREKIMLPVVLACSDGTEIQAFSRNLSNTGICVVAREPIARGTECLIRISQSNGRITSVAGRNVWAKAFGSAHCISGWQFVGQDDEYYS